MSETHQKTENAQYITKVSSNINWFWKFLFMALNSCLFETGVRNFHFPNTKLSWHSAS